MEAAEAEEALKVLEASLSHIKWRLKSSSKRRLRIDVLALCTGMRPVVMIDYGGKMPELQENLCAFLEHSQKISMHLEDLWRIISPYPCLDIHQTWVSDTGTSRKMKSRSNVVCRHSNLNPTILRSYPIHIEKESPIFEQLRVMVIEDMIYLIHVKEMAKYVSSTLSSEVELLFVDLELDPPKMRTLEDKNLLGMQLRSIQKLFSLYFPLEGMRNDLLPPDRMDFGADSESLSEPINSRSSLLMDLSSCMHDTKVTIPTINGWLLGYPVMYLFSKDHIGDAIYNLSTKFLRIYKILVSRQSIPNKGSHPEELMSFSVPYDLSMRGSHEPWAETFLAGLQSKWGRCKQAWSSLEMEVSECYPQAIAL